MSTIFAIAFLIIHAIFCGYTAKLINESKGYQGGFLLGLLLTELGILIVAFKKALPDAPPSSYKAVPLQNVLKKFHYPFKKVEVETVGPFKGSIGAESEAASYNLTFLLIHGIFMLCWYCTLLGIYLYYILGYTIYWLIKYRLLKNGTSGLKADAAEKAALAKEKAGAAFAGLKGKAADFSAQRKKADGSDTSVNGVIEANKSTVDEKKDAELVQETAESESFDELYEKAMSNVDDVEKFNETSDEISYDTESHLPNDSIEEPIAPKISRAPAPTAMMNTSSTAAPQQYDYEKKKSSVVYIMAGVIGVLLVGSGILGGMLLMKNKDDKDSDNSSNNAVVTTTSNSETTVEGTQIDTSTTSENMSEKPTETTTVAETTATEATTEATTEAAPPENGLKAFPASDINNYPQYIQTIKDGMNSGYYTASSASYGLYDLNNDNKPELIINTAPYGIYAMDYESCVELQSSFRATRSPSLALTDKGFIKLTYVTPQGEVSVSYWKYFGGSQLAMQDDGGYASHFGNDIALELTPVSSIAGITDNGDNQGASKITPVEKYGTIYSPAGYKVKGYAKSYLIDGGAESYVRQDLTDGWHIKAVNSYSTDAAEWYELYDADDGDYYGWVSNHNISFY